MSEIKIVITTQEKHQKLRWMINWLLKSGLVAKLKRLNNIANYGILEWKLTKNQEKCFILFLELEENKDKVLWIINKMWIDFDVI